MFPFRSCLFRRVPFFHTFPLNNKKIFSKSAHTNTRHDTQDATLFFFCGVLPRMPDAVSTGFRFSLHEFSTRAAFFFPCPPLFFGVLLSTPTIHPSHPSKTHKNQFHHRSTLPQRFLKTDTSPPGQFRPPFVFFDPFPLLLDNFPRHHSRTITPPHGALYAPHANTPKFFFGLRSTTAG